jgi:hypothetical protein
LAAAAPPQAPARALSSPELQVTNSAATYQRATLKEKEILSKTRDYYGREDIAHLSRGYNWLSHRFVVGINFKHRSNSGTVLHSRIR